MNKVILMGRLVRDPDVKYTQGQIQTAVARFTLAVDRKRKMNNQQILSHALHLVRLASLQKSISTKGLKLCLPDIGKQVHIQTKMVKRFTQMIALLKI